MVDAVDDGIKVCATLTSARGAGGSEGEPLPAVTLNDDVLRMLLVGSAERDLMGLVVRFNVFDDSRHSPASSYRLIATRKTRERQYRYYCHYPPYRHMRVRSRPSGDV